MSTTLGVFLRNVHGVQEGGYGWLLSLNAALVVLFQIPLTRRLAKRPPMALMAAGAALLGAGFLMYGLVATYPLFLLGVAVITLGEMIMLPVSTALVVNLAPVHMRGRYSFIYNLSWGVAYAAGPLLAGMVMDHFNPNWLWYACGLLGAAAAGGFVLLNARRQNLPIPESSPEGGI
jgi:MFS family permease